MDGKFKKSIILSIVIIVIGFLIYWAGLTSPKKEVVSKKEMVQDVDTKEVLPLYSIYYKWDGKQQKNASWMIFKKYDVWRVIELKNINTARTREDILKFAVRFDYKWIDSYGFSAQPSRYQIILMILGAQPTLSSAQPSRYQTILMILGVQPTFSDEQRIFFEIINDIKKQGK